MSQEIDPKVVPYVEVLEKHIGEVWTSAFKAILHTESLHSQPMLPLDEDTDPDPNAWPPWAKQGHHRPKPGRP